MDTTIISVNVDKDQENYKLTSSNAVGLDVINFSALNLKEDHIESFLAENLNILMGDAILVGRQVVNEQKSRADLVALDSDGCLVVIEIKRDMADCKAQAEKFEMQAIRYAATYSRIRTVDELAELVYAPYLRKFESSAVADKDAVQVAKEKIVGIIKNSEFNSRQKIILVASDFDKEVISACAWLVQNGIDISCIRLSPVRNGDSQLLLVVERVVPPPSLDEMLTPVARQQAVAAEVSGISDESKKTRTTLPTLSALFEQKQIKTGDTVTIKDRNESSAKVLNQKLVEYQGQQLPWNEWAKRVTGWSAVNIYANVMLGDKSLDDLRWGR